MSTAIEYRTKATSTNSLQSQSTFSTMRFNTFSELDKSVTSIQTTKSEENYKKEIFNSLNYDFDAIHPIWKNWNGLWKMEPYILFPEEIPKPSIETELEGACYRIYPEFPYQMLGFPVIHQGTTFVFKGFENPTVRYVVEWCMKKDHKYAYLKVVGTTAEGQPIRYNDPEFPSFILAIPVSLCLTPLYSTCMDPPLMKKEKLGLVKTVSGVIKKIRDYFKK